MQGLQQQPSSRIPSPLQIITQVRVHLSPPSRRPFKLSKQLLPGDVTTVTTQHIGLG
jgi:hypothetical protein